MSRSLSGAVSERLCPRHLACLTVLVLCALPILACNSKAESVTVRFESADGRVTPPISAELAVTPGARQLGLMYRRELADSEGMLFIFPEEAQRSFWMKNTYLELDIIFLDREQKVVSISERAVPLTETARPSKGPAQYVLELRGGRAQALGIAPGSRMVSERPLPLPHS